MKTLKTLKTVFVVALLACTWTHACSWECQADEPTGQPPASDAPPPTNSGGSGLPDTRATLQPFLQKFCVDCHGAETQEAQVRFDSVAWEITNNDNAQRWQDVLDQLNGGDMPPEDADQPTNEELSTALSALTGALLEARRRLTDTGGEIKMRRLNRREYSNTVRDLFGFDVSAEDIPEDGEIASFDTVGAEQFFTSMHFEQYFELGKKVAADALNFNTRRYEKSRVNRVEVEEGVTKKMRSELADMDRKMAMKKAGKNWKEMGFKDEGEMQILFKQWFGRAEQRREYLQYPLIDRGVYLCDVAKWVTARRHTDIRGEYILRVHGGTVGEVDPIRRVLQFYNRQRIHGTLQLTGTTEKPGTAELRTRSSMGRSFLSVSARENIPDHSVETSSRSFRRAIQGPENERNPWATLWIDWYEIEGPFYPAKRPRFEDIMFPGVQTGDPNVRRWGDEHARQLIHRFTYEAFRRRKPTAEYLANLHALYKQNRLVGVSFRDSMIEVMGVVLASPGFLFLQEEPASEPGQRRRLDCRELAIRLSYFLWSGPPDDELYAANLTDDAVYAQQVDRMLADPKSLAFRTGFMNQWAELDRFDAITIDEKKMLRFNTGLRQEARREASEFFGTLIDENLPASNLIDSDFVTVNAALAAHYDLPGVNSTTGDFQKIKLPVGSPRGGLLTQAAFLTTGSNGERSSPVIRGALVMEKLLHDAPAPPPPNVPELGSASDQPKTNREMVKLHQQQAVCASCHKTMDVIGFGLENFDTIGRWRDTEKVGRKQVAIEPGGTLPNGAAFKNVQELKSVLLQYNEQLAHELVESMMAYGLGRTIEFSDSDDVEEIVNRLRKDDFRVRSMIREVALSKLFKVK